MYYTTVMIIEGILAKGLGHATETIPSQKELFKELGLPNVEKFFNGTLNIDISPRKFSVLKYDYFFKAVEWGSKNNKAEDFGFIKIAALEYADEHYDQVGYIYVPFNSPHFSNPSQFEVISIPIPKIEMGNKIRIHIDSNKIKLL